MKNAKHVLGAIGAMALILGVSGCAATDVVGKVAKSSFKAVLEAGSVRTPDLGGSSSTEDVAAAVVAKLTNEVLTVPCRKAAAMVAIA